MSGKPLLTISITYFDEPHWLERWMDAQALWEEQGLPIHFQVIDDGSEIHPALPHLAHRPANTSLYTVTENVGFNSHGCRNLAMRVAPTDWVLLTDIDRSYTLETLKAIIDDISNNTITEDEYYAFMETNWISAGWSVNELIVHKNAFRQTGGYDEEFVNIHYGDRLFLENLSQIAKRIETERYRVKYLRAGKRMIISKTARRTEYIGDSMIMHPPGFFSDKQKRREMIDMIKMRNRDPIARRAKKTIQFPWRKDL